MNELMLRRWPLAAAALAVLRADRMRHPRSHDRRDRGAQDSAVGVAAPATVVQIWDTGVTVNDDPVVGFLLDVKPEGQAPFQAKTKALVSRLAVPRVQPGAQLKVMYDPKDTTRVALDPVR